MEKPGQDPAGVPAVAEGTVRHHLESEQRVDAARPGLGQYRRDGPRSGDLVSPRLTAAASIAEATASVACTWAMAAQTAVVSAPPPWPRYSTASAANSSALPFWSGTVNSPPVVPRPAVPSPCPSPPRSPPAGPATSSIRLVHRTIRSVDRRARGQPRAWDMAFPPAGRRCRMVAPEDIDVAGHVHVNAARLWAGDATDARHAGPGFPAS
jgi:hypothetical protein